MDEFVRLTPDRQSRAGWIYNVDQCYIHNWRATAQIRMHGAGGRVFGDGMAIWYRAMAPRKMSTGEVFGAPDRFSGLGVFLDTFDNNADRNNPIISVMVGDGATAYDNMDGMKTAVAHCSAEIRGTPEPVVIEIQYLNAVLTVRYTLGTLHARPEEWVSCVEIEDVDLPLGYHFGLSAATGDVADNHDVYSFHVMNLGGLNDIQNGADPNRAPGILGDASNLAENGVTNIAVTTRNNNARQSSSASSDSSGSSVGWIIVLLIILLIIGGVIAYVVYALSQDDKKRF